MIRVAMETDDSRLRTALINSLPEGDPSDQQVILAAIADLGLVEYESNVLALLPTSTAAVQDVAVRTLGVIGSKASFTPLYEHFLANGGDTVTYALARLKAPSVDPQTVQDAG